MQIGKIDWGDLLESYGKQVLIALVSLVLLLYFGFRFFGNFTNSSASDYLRADELCERLFATAAPGEEMLTQAVQIVDKNSSIQSKHGARMAQRLLDENQPAKALVLGEKGIKKVEELSPLYARFAKNSLAIAKGEYPSALEEAKLFKENLSYEKRSLLYHFNLLRIAMLEMHLGNRESERQSWNELLKAGEENPHEWMIVQSCFQKEALALTDLIQARLKP